jgi:hypothetical protein
LGCYELSRCQRSGMHFNSYHIVKDMYINIVFFLCNFTDLIGLDVHFLQVEIHYCKANHTAYS